MWLADIRETVEMDAAWLAWIPADAKPVRATVQALLAGPDARVEIMYDRREVSLKKRGDAVRQARIGICALRRQGRRVKGPSTISAPVATAPEGRRRGKVT